ncbi:MAG: Ig-like domain repeat protein, partial [Armatimonadota bacterium]|nr:Ig-like domain repeat protein [Armatimonadota bacterium]
DSAVFRRYADTIVSVADVSGRRGDTVSLKAVLKRAHDGALIVGSTLNFAVDGTTVGSAVTNSSGIASVNYTIPAGMSLGAHSITVTFAGDDPLNPSRGTGTLTVAASTRRVAGTVDLQDFSGDPTTQSVTIEIRNTGSTSPLETHVVSLNASSQYSFDTTLSGTFDVAAKGSHWLRHTRTSISITTNVTVNFSLVNGDVDGDNEVTLFDFGELVAAFGSVPGDDNWNPSADLDGDEEVTLFDFGILVRNFGAIGDD